MWEKISLIYLMRDVLFNLNNINNIQDIEIIPSKSKYILKIFGGELSQEDYKKDS